MGPSGSRQQQIWESGHLPKKSEQAKPEAGQVDPVVPLLAEEHAGLVDLFHLEQHGGRVGGCRGESGDQESRGGSSLRVCFLAAQATVRAGPRVA